MQNLLNFWCAIFWLSIIVFITNINNLIKLVFYSELVWIIFYCYVVILGSINDDITLLSLSFFLLGFAGLEYSIGILLILLFKNINNSENIFDTNEVDKNKIIFNKSFNLQNIKKN